MAMIIQNWQTSQYIFQIHLFFQHKRELFNHLFDSLDVTIVTFSRLDYLFVIISMGERERDKKFVSHNN